MYAGSRMGSCPVLLRCEQPEQARRGAADRRVPHVACARRVALSRSSLSAALSAATSALTTLTAATDAAGRAAWAGLLEVAPLCSSSAAFCMGTASGTRINCAVRSCRPNPITHENLRPLRFGGPPIPSHEPFSGCPSCANIGAAMTRHARRPEETFSFASVFLLKISAVSVEILAPLNESGIRMIGATIAGLALMKEAQQRIQQIVLAARQVHWFWALVFGNHLCARSNFRTPEPGNFGGAGNARLRSGRGTSRRQNIASI